ncbi:MAG: HipA N-terminal domain-containing protein [Tannerellaceae bacterium]|jgi:serine/threonine-protein kinase HipA|nr:HipA N-terminal domain-containing protein [Tannerellaceae bacterium]
MRKANVYCKGILAGELVETSDRKYVFRYDEAYFKYPAKPAISLTLPKSQAEFHSDCLFPFFFNMLSEGNNRTIQARLLHIDEKDHFGILLATAQHDAIGAIIVKPVSV